MLGRIIIDIRGIALCMTFFAMSLCFSSVEGLSDVSSWRTVQAGICVHVLLDGDVRLQPSVCAVILGRMRFFIRQEIVRRGGNFFSRRHQISFIISMQASTADTVGRHY